MKQDGIVSGLPTTDTIGYVQIRKARGMIYYDRIVNGDLAVYNRADTVVDYCQRRAENFT